MIGIDLEVFIWDPTKYMGISKIPDVTEFYQLLHIILQNTHPMYFFHITKIAELDEIHKADFAWSSYLHYLSIYWGNKIVFGHDKTSIIFFGLINFCEILLNCLCNTKLFFIKT